MHASDLQRIERKLDEILGHARNPESYLLRAQLEALRIDRDRLDKENARLTNERDTLVEARESLVQWRDALEDLAALLDGDGGQRQDNDPSLDVTVARMREATKRLRADLAEALDNLAEALIDLEGMVANACTTGDALTSHRSYTNVGALRTLAKHGKVKIVEDDGDRMVTAQWVQP